MLEDGLEDVESMYTTQLNDYFYNPRKKTCTQLHIHNVNYTIRNGTTEDGIHIGTKEDGTQNDSKLKPTHTHSLEHTCIHTVELPNLNI